MTAWRHGNRKPLAAVLLAATTLALTGCGGSSSSEEEAAPNVVQKASCGAGDSPETALQGQVPAAMRQAGFKGFSCNLQLIGQSRNEGGSWQHAFFQDKAGNKCSYYDSSSATAGRTQNGVAVINTTDPAHPVATAFLNTTAMIDPWESLKVNERRQLLGGVNALNGNGGPEIELYDTCLGGRDCRFTETEALHSAVVKGPTPLHGANITVPDIRGGFAYVIAAAAADGPTTLHDIHHIERGYHRAFESFSDLGLKIERV